MDEKMTEASSIYLKVNELYSLFEKCPESSKPINNYNFKTDFFGKYDDNYGNVSDKSMD